MIFSTIQIRKIAISEYKRLSGKDTQFTVEFNPRFTSKIASINVRKRHIKISEKFVHQATLEDITEIIKHEISHQYCYDNNIPHHDNDYQHKMFCIKNNIELSFQRPSYTTRKKRTPRTIKCLKCGETFKSHIRKLSKYKHKCGGTLEWT